jgi:hypothetical protein
MSQLDLILLGKSKALMKMAVVCWLLLCAVCTPPPPPAWLLLPYVGSCRRWC